MSNKLKHALFSPSQASKWTKSPAEAIYSCILKQPSTEDAERDIFLHKSVSKWLNAFDGLSYDLGFRHSPHGLSFYEERIYNTVIKELKKWIRKHTSKTKSIKWMASEGIVDFQFLIKDLDSYKESGLGKIAFGTVDLLMQVDDELYVIDFEFGRQMVSAKDNPQLMLSAAANLDRYKAFVDHLDAIANIDFNLDKITSVLISYYLDRNLPTPSLIPVLMKGHVKYNYDVNQLIYLLGIEVVSKLAALRLIYEDLERLPKESILAAEFKTKLELAMANLERWRLNIQEVTDPEKVKMKATEIDDANRTLWYDSDGYLMSHSLATDEVIADAKRLNDRLKEMRRIIIDSTPAEEDTNPLNGYYSRREYVSKFNIPTDISKITTVIIQPLPDSDEKVSIDSASYTPAEVIEFVNKYVPTMDRVLQIYNGTEELSASDFDLSCEYSNAPGIFNMLLVDKFKEFIKLKALPETDLSSALSLVPDVERFIKELKQQAAEVVSKGGKVPGFELRDIESDN